MIKNPFQTDSSPPMIDAFKTLATVVVDAEQASNVNISTEKLAKRQRRIAAVIAIPQSLEQVWAILTDYDRLAEFIPNLTVSRRVEHPQGGVRLEQIGAQCFLNIKVCARVILDMYEKFPRELGFSMVEGDFKQFMGTWRLQPADIGGHLGTLLSYELIVQPPLAMPVALIERHICRHLTQNLTAIRQYAMG